MEYNFPESDVKTGSVLVRGESSALGTRRWGQKCEECVYSPEKGGWRMAQGCGTERGGDRREHGDVLLQAARPLDTEQWGGSGGAERPSPENHLVSVKKKKKKHRFLFLAPNILVLSGFLFSQVSFTLE